MNLLIFHSKSKEFMLMQTSWQKAIQPVITNQINQGLLVTGIKLINGVTTVNHLLGRQMTGFIQTDLDAAVTYYRSQPLNDKTLTLTSTGAANLSLWVF